MKLVLHGQKKYIEDMAKHLAKEHPSTRGRMDVVKDKAKLPEFDFSNDIEFAQIRTDHNLSKLFGGKK